MRMKRGFPKIALCSVVHMRNRRRMAVAVGSTTSFGIRPFDGTDARLMIAGGGNRVEPAGVLAKTQAHR